MPKFNIFLDSGALIAGAISESGAAHVLLNLGESQDIVLTVSELVIIETERAMAKKAPGNLNDLRSLIKSSNLRIVDNPPRRKWKQTFISSMTQMMYPVCSPRWKQKWIISLRIIADIFLMIQKWQRYPDWGSEHQAMSLHGWERTYNKDQWTTLSRSARII